MPCISRSSFRGSPGRFLLIHGNYSRERSGAGPSLRGPPVHAGRVLLRRVQIALEPASKAPGLHGVFMRDKGLKFVIADSAFKRKQVDARACRLDTGEHHPGLALRTSGARNCSEWNGGRKALRLGHDAFPRIGGSATLSPRWFELTTKGRPRTHRPNLAGFSLLFAGGGLLLLTRRIAMLLGNSRKSGGPPLFAPSFKVQRDNAHNPSSGFRGRPRSRRP